MLQAVVGLVVVVPVVVVVAVAFGVEHVVVDVLAVVDDNGDVFVLVVVVASVADVVVGCCLIKIMLTSISGNILTAV